MRKSAALDLLFADYDSQFPGASEFERGSYVFEVNKVVNAMERLGLFEPSLVAPLTIDNDPHGHAAIERMAVELEDIVPAFPVSERRWHETPAWRRGEIRYMAWTHGLTIVVLEDEPPS